MGKIIRTLILGGLVIAGAFFAFEAHTKQVADLELQLGREKLRAEYVERAGWVRSISAVDRYRDELAALNKWYDASLSELYNRFPGTLVADKSMKEIEAQAAAGQLKGNDLALRKEVVNHTKEFHDLLASGRYNPMVTTTLSGVRVDVMDFRKVVYEGKPKLRIDAVVWGAPRRSWVQKTDGKATSTKSELDFDFTGLALEFIDGNKKLLGGAETGGPILPVDMPERWFETFPPQAAIATWWIEPFPFEAATVKVNLAGEIRSPSNGPFPISQDWVFKNKPEWSLAEGQKFEGEERVMAEEEIDRSKE